MKIRLLTAKLKPVVIVALMLMGVMAAQAQYSISSFSGKVEVKHAGRMAAATTGMKLSAADMIYIGEGSKVQILDSRDSKLYERDIPGEIGLTSLIFEAKKAARDNASAVHRKVSLGKPVSEEEGKMYVEKGKITLALEEYDPAGENFMIDAKVMARYIVSALKSGNYDSRFPTELQHESASGNLMFGASGPGGQSVNTTYSAIRLTHIPTGIVVQCQDQKSQLKNFDKAFEELRTRVFNLEYSKYLDEIASKRKTMVSTGDRSAKIRTYNYPQGRITDHRINYTIYNLSAFMDGEIQDVIDHLIVAENAERLKESEL